MNISTSKAMGRVEVTVIRPEGQLDGQSYMELIDKARELFNNGARNFLLDMSGITYISSAGLVALHSVALLTNGEALPDTEAGWSTFRSMKAKVPGVQAHVKLFNPREEVKNVLEMVGFTSVFSIFKNLDEAVKSF
jgi:anti-anti-sigma regulatory factor